MGSLVLLALVETLVVVGNLALKSSQPLVYILIMCRNLRGPPAKLDGGANPAAIHPHQYLLSKFPYEM